MDFLPRGNWTLGQDTAGQWTDLVYVRENEYAEREANIESLIVANNGVVDGSFSVRIFGGTESINQIVIPNYIIPAKQSYMVGLDCIHLSQGQVLQVMSDVPDMEFSAHGTHFVLTDNGIGPAHPPKVYPEEPQDPNINYPVDPLDGRPRFVDIDSYWDIAIAIDEEGNVWGTGGNKGVGLGFPADQTENITRFTKLTIPTEAKVIKVATGWQTSMLLTEDGAVYGAGRYGHYVGKPLGYIYEYTQTRSQGIADISMNIATGLIRTDSGYIYSSGGNYNQTYLGRNTEPNDYGETWERVEQHHRIEATFIPAAPIFNEVEYITEYLDRCVQMTQFWYTSYGLTSSGEAFVWGDNAQYNHGYGHHYDAKFASKMLLSADKIVAGHSVTFLLNGGRWYWAGEKGVYGPQPRATEFQEDTTITQLQVLEGDVMEINYGTEGGFAYPTNGEKLYSCGSNWYGETGFIENRDSDDWHDWIDTGWRNIRKAVTGYMTSFVIDEHGQIWACGHNDNKGAVGCGSFHNGVYGWHRSLVDGFGPIPNEDGFIFSRAQWGWDTCAFVELVEPIVLNDGDFMDFEFDPQLVLEAFGVTEDESEWFRSLHRDELIQPFFSYSGRGTAPDATISGRLGGDIQASGTAYGFNDYELQSSIEGLGENPLTLEVIANVYTTQAEIDTRNKEHIPWAGTSTIRVTNNSGVRIEFDLINTQSFCKYGSRGKFHSVVVNGGERTIDLSMDWNKQELTPVFIGR